jgi:hypothetical protein
MGKDDLNFALSVNRSDHADGISGEVRRLYG